MSARSLKGSQALLREAKSIMDGAAGRTMSSGEIAEVEDLLNAAEGAVAVERQRDAFSTAAGAMNASSGGSDIGARFISSKGYQAIKNADARSQNWTTGVIDVGYGFKGNLFEGGGGTLVPPDYTGGIVQKPSTPLGLADYFGQVQTSSNSVRYSVEGTVTNAAAGVAEGGTKPESTLALSEVNEPVKKLATVLPISDELLEDAPAVSTYLNHRLTQFVRVEEERQILRGVGTSELVGIFGRSISSYGPGTATANHVQLFRAAAGIRGSASVDPDLVVLHPDNWVTTRLATDSAGQYLGGGPWQGSYGQQSSVSAGYFSSAPLWGMNVFVSPHVGAGTALVGNASQAAAIYRRGGVTVEATNSHSDLFVKNISMIRAEERLALAIYQPSAWCQVTTLT